MPNDRRRKRPTRTRAASDMQDAGRRSSSAEDTPRSASSAAAAAEHPGGLGGLYAARAMRLSAESMTPRRPLRSALIGLDLLRRLDVRVVERRR